jgi:hypothetical protein
MTPGTTANATKREMATFTIRLAFFILTLVPLAAFLLPWLTLNGTGETHTGISTVALLASPLRTYLYEVNLIQAGTLTMGPAIIGLLAMATSYSYHRRKSIYWAPLVMLAIAIYFPYGTVHLVDTTHIGLGTVAAIAAVLVMHQTLIRIQVALRRRGKLPSVYRSLAVATGIGYYRWGET